MMLQAQVTSLKKKLRAFNISAIQLQSQVCDLCGGYLSDGECQVGQANYVNNFQRSNNPYANTNTSAWKNHPNLSWGNNNNVLNPDNLQQHLQHPPLQEKKQAWRPQ